MEDVSCRRNHGAGILHGGGIMEDASGGHLGRIWKHLEAPRMHPGGTQEAPRKHPEGPRPPRRLQGVCDSKSSTPVN